MLAGYVARIAARQLRITEWQDSGIAAVLSALNQIKVDSSLNMRRYFDTVANELLLSFIGNGIPAHFGERFEVCFWLSINVQQWPPELKINPQKFRTLLKVSLLAWRVGSGCTPATHGRTRCIDSIMYLVVGWRVLL